MAKEKEPAKIEKSADIITEAEKAARSVELEIEGKRFAQILSEFLTHLEEKAIVYRFIERNELLRVKLEKDAHGKIKTITVFDKDRNVQEFIDLGTLMKAAKNPDIINPAWIENKLENFRNQLEEAAKEPDEMEEFVEEKL